jgi:signal transduction histidine kinase
MRKWLLRRTPGVRARVTLAAILAMAVAFAVSAFLVERTLQHDRTNILNETGQLDLQEVLALNPTLGPNWKVENSSIAEGGLLQIDQAVDQNVKAVAFSKVLRGVPALWNPQTEGIQAQTDPELADYPQLAKALDVHQINLVVPEAKPRTTVVVLVSLSQYDRGVRSIQRLLEFGLPILLAVLALICWYMVGLALTRIEKLRREVNEVATRPGGRRVAEPRTDDEVGRLARTLNSMLDRLEELSSRERRFVADASHELRSPIANIRTALEVALHRPDEADWHRVAADVLTEDHRMGRLVEELLLLARSDEGRLMTSDGVSDLLAATQRSVAMVSAAHGPDPEVTGLPVLVGVPDAYLEHIVANLVANAKRFATARVEVRVRSEGSQAVLSVRDDGPGVLAADRDRIFERFVRLDEARDREHGGFGLGLAIVADLVRAYGGRIEVGDAVPGAVFWVRFPLARTQAAPAPPPARQPLPPSKPEEHQPTRLPARQVG